MFRWLMDEYKGTWIARTRERFAILVELRLVLKICRAPLYSIVDIYQCGFWVGLTLAKQWKGEGMVTYSM